MREREIEYKIFVLILCFSRRIEFPDSHLEYFKETANYARKTKSKRAISWGFAYNRKQFP